MNSDDRLALRDVLPRPRADFRELALVELPPRGIEIPGVPLPASLAREGCERRLGRGLHPRQQARRIVRAGARRRDGAPHQHHEDAESK
jgi:hypothetical protein